MAITLVDFSQTVISSCAVQSKELRGADKGMIKHICLNQILSLKRKFPGKVILCVDAKNYWRRDRFPHYKGHRTHSRDSSSLDWELVFETLNEFKEDLKENFPYIVLEVQNAEADDCIAVLTKHFQENELINTGLIEEPQDIMIVSSDGDMRQLQKYHGVRQWSNIEKKFVVEKNPKKWLIENICSGQAKDNIPSITNGDTWSKARADNCPVRASPFKTARLIDFYNKGIDACLDESERTHYKRNELLIDFDLIPDAIYTRVVKEYMDYEIKGSKIKVYNYLTQNRMKLLLGSASDF